MYTEEDIENLAEFLHLAYNKSMWEVGLAIGLYEWKECIEESKNSWRAAAKVALEFKSNH